MKLPLQNTSKRRLITNGEKEEKKFRSIKGYTVEYFVGGIWF